MAIYLKGLVTWGQMTRDEEGHREYHPVFRVGCAITDGPANIIASGVLPAPGTPWLISGDVDQWAWCHANLDIKPSVQRGANTQFDCTLIFTTRPPKRCMDLQITDPLLEPPKLSGSFVKGKVEAVEDRWGRKITNSAWEQIRGPHVEFDYSTMTVKIEQNVADLQLDLLSWFKDSVNDAPLWGCQARCIKLSNVTWERLFHGLCQVYYKRTLEFDIDVRTFDRVLLDEATKVLNGHWGNTRNGDINEYWQLDKWANDGTTPDPDPNKPAHFIQYKDRNGHPGKVILNGQGIPFQGELISANTNLPIPQKPADVLLEDTTHDEAEAMMQELVMGGLPAGVTAELVGPYWTFIGVWEEALIHNPSLKDYEEPRAWKITFSSTTEQEGFLPVEYYPENNFLLLGIPTNLANA